MISVEIVTVHYRTEKLLIRLYQSVRRYISPDIQFRVIDGSCGSEYISEFERVSHGDVCCILEKMPYNIHHGRGMNYAMATSDKDAILFLDTDVEITKAGLLSKMLRCIGSDTYGCGQIVSVSKSGVNSMGGIPYLHPRCALIVRRQYNKYPRFIHHGAPCIRTMLQLHYLGESNGSGGKIVSVPGILRYFSEDGRGTVSKYGYGDVSSTKSEQVFNILIRTSNRPNYFRECYKSIAMQQYSNYFIVVSYDDDADLEYLKEYNIDVLVKVERIDPNDVPDLYEFGYRYSPAPYNGYYAEMYKHVKNGYIVHLDDDDGFNDYQALASINKHLNGCTDAFVMWRVKFPSGLIPPMSSFGVRPVRNRVSGIGYSFHSKYVHLADWRMHRLGDYRTAVSMYDNLKNRIFINMPLTRILRDVANGFGRRDDK